MAVAGEHRDPVAGHEALAREGVAEPAGAVRQLAVRQADVAADDGAALPTHDHPAAQHAAERPRRPPVTTHPDPSSPSPSVEVEHDPLRSRVRLTGEHHPRLDLVLLEGVGVVHRHLALDDPAPARPADAALARVGRVGAVAQRGLEDRPAVAPGTSTRRPSSTIVTVAAPLRPRRQAGAATGAASAWNSSRWMCSGPRRARAAAPGRPAPSRTARTGTTRRRSSGGSSASSSAPSRLRVQAPLQQRHRLGLARQDVDELQAGRVPVLQVLELLDEHDRVGAAVAVDHACSGCRAPRRARSRRSR